MSKPLSDLCQSIEPSITLQLTAKAKELKAMGEDVIGFTAGEPDFNTPDHICDAAIKAIHNGKTKYTPATGIEELKIAIAKKLKFDNKLDYEPSQIIVSNGAKHSLYNALFGLCNPGDKVILPAPYWVSYSEMIKLVRSEPVIVKGKEENGFKITVEQLKTLNLEGIKAIIINNPSNPTGALYTKEELLSIAQWCVEQDIYIIADEIYEKLVYDGIEFISIASLSEDIKAKTVIINGMSKAFSMTGWRIGYLVSNNMELINSIASFQSHVASNPCSISQYASVSALNESEHFISDMRQTFENRRDLMIKLIDEIPYISCIKPNGAFYIFANIKELIGKVINGRKIEGSMDVANLFLEELKVSVVPGIGFGADEYIRLSYSISEEDITKGLGRIKEYLSSVRL